MSKPFRSALFAATVALFVGTGAQAAIVTSLYSTGLTAGGTTQLAGATDAHYIVVENGLASAVVVSDPAYFPNDAQSQWIWQQADGLPVNVTRTFRTTFDLTGFDFTTASITGLWGTDNFGEDITINGVSTGIALPGMVSSNYTSLNAFSIASGFQAGINTLEFRVRDVGVIAGFRAQLTGEADILSAVPEPGTLALAALGLFVAASARSRKPS